MPKLGQRRNQPQRPLTEIFSEALLQKRSDSAIIRIKLAYFFKMTDATTEATAEEVAAATKTDKIGKSTISNIINGAGHINDKNFEQFRALEDHIHGHLSPDDYRKITRELGSIISKNPDKYKKRDTNRIMREFAQLVLPQERQPKILPLELYLQEKGFDANAIALMTSRSNMEKTLRAIRDHQEDDHAMRVGLRAIINKSIADMTGQSPRANDAPPPPQA